MVTTPPILGTVPLSLVSRRRGRGRSATSRGRPRCRSPSAPPAAGPDAQVRPRSAACADERPAPSWIAAPARRAAGRRTPAASRRRCSRAPRSAWWISTSRSRMLGDLAGGERAAARATRSIATVPSSSAGSSATASATSVVAPRSRLADSAAAGRTARRCRRRGPPGRRTSAPVALDQPSRAPASPSALRVRCATTWPRLQPGSAGWARRRP